MRVTESLLRQNNMKKNKKKSDNEEDEPTQSYREKKYEYWALNQNKTAFDSPMDEGINTRASVFERQAVFRTKEGEK